MDDHELADLVDDLREQLQEARDAGRAQQSVIAAHEEARRQAETTLSVEQERNVWLETQWSLLLDHVTQGLLSKPYEFADIKSVVDDVFTKNAQEYADEETAGMREELAAERAAHEKLKAWTMEEGQLIAVERDAALIELAAERAKR